MANPINQLTGDIPLILAKEITKKVDEVWESGEFLELVTPTTKDLLKFWFCSSYVENRDINFHLGQKRAILNTIYLHEVLKIDTVKDMYEYFDKQFIEGIFKRVEDEKEVEKIIKQFEAIKENQLSKQKYQIPKYAIKMATGTGKTFVMNALLIWQYLNAKAEDVASGLYSKNFLIVAPGLIVYERLLDSYLGKLQEDGSRDIKTSDILKNQELFLPEHFRSSIEAFLSSSVVKKEEIGKKITGSGMIAISNWHLFMQKEEKDELLLRPGKSSGNSLEVLDSSYLRGSEIEYLEELDDLVVMNDEAHHIHENKVAGEIKEVEWQESLNKISQNKGRRFVQVDFSATPYDTTGSGQKRTKHYFPHVVVDFDLKNAFENGLVKLLALDKRKEISAIGELDYKAIRDDKGKVEDLSDGQKLMIEAGFSKLQELEEYFKTLKPVKYPKMLIMCEDTDVVDRVEEYLQENKEMKDKYLAIHSNKRGELKADEYEKLKNRLFNLDNEKDTKIVISVLMLKEGFDVNNVCVIVPLRSTESSILLEQTIGRGLRLMFRDTESFEDRIQKYMALREKREPSSPLDILHIIEHPRFAEFYDDLMKEGLVIPDSGKTGEGRDYISIELKKDYKKYDMFFINILQDEEEVLEELEFSYSGLAPYTGHTLKRLLELKEMGQKFQSEEITTRTNFGEYKINASIFATAKSYYEYLQNLLEIITHQQSLKKLGGKKNYKIPTLQIYQAKLLGVLDGYIKNRLFEGSFEPLKDDNWKIFLLKNTNLTNHIVNQMHKMIYETQNSTKTIPAVVEKRYFSEVDSFSWNKKHCLDLVKTIYQKTPYPSNSGGFEKDFLDFLDRDSKVVRFIKILEFKHNFATISYFRDDGLMANYYPDFMVESQDTIYIIETKSKRDEDNQNVKLKQKATLEYIKQINSLSKEQRGGKEWKYLLIFDKDFYEIADGANVKDLERIAKNITLDDLGI